MFSVSGTPGGAPMRVRLLGGFEIEGLDERALGTRKGRTLLRRLAAARGRPVPVGELADTLWGDDLPRNPSDQLSVLISRLRGVLGGERLRRGDAGYWLVADWIDLVEVEARTREVEERLRLGQVSSALAAAQGALAMVRGPLLPEEEGAWVDVARAEADRVVARARLAAAEAALAVGDAATARSAAGAALDQDPYDEAALRLVMRADLAAGRPAAALAAYETVRCRLAEDLGTNPAPETREQHVAVLQGRSPAAPPVSADSPPLVGRVGELRALDAALGRARAGPAVAVIVEGDAGMGKSALLHAWTAQASSGALMISGRCDELGRDLPLQPLVDGLAGHLRGLRREEAAALLGAEATVLGPLLGPIPRAESATVVTTVADPGSGRMALFGALAAVLDRAARATPIALVIDDLHVAAPGTAEFLAFALRRVHRLLVVATRRPDPGPDLPEAERITLGPLTLVDAVALVGAERAPSLHQRSGGHPLFLVELARAVDGELPRSVVEAVRARLARLGDAAATVQVAAVLGPAVNIDLLATVAGRTVPAVLDDLERAAEARLLVPRGPVLAFTHELVRQAIETSTSPARRALVHRAAATSLAARAGADPLVIASHARLGGDLALGAEALTTAAALAAARFETGEAEELLDEAVALADTAAVRLARGRLRLGRLDLDAAREDAERAVDLGAGPHAFELAGWVAYYARDHGTARRYADEGADRATDDGIRASCLALGGRIRHTRGELADAAGRLAEAVAVAPPSVRGVAQVWRAQLLVHLGEPEAAAEQARRGLLDPHAAHPFAPLHGRFTLAVALALSGHWAEALDAVDDLDRDTARRGDRRFPPVNANVRGWLMRGAGLVDVASDLHREAAAVALGPSFLEPHYAALLDLCEDRLTAADTEAAVSALEGCDGIHEWEGSMSWRHRQRHRLLTARVALAGGDHAAAAERAHLLAIAAADRGDPRYECRARLLAATADALGGRRIDAAAISVAVERFLPVAGPDGWRELADLAAATRSEEWFRRAELLAAAVARGAAQRAGVDGDHVARTLRAELDHRHR